MAECTVAGGQEGRADLPGEASERGSISGCERLSVLPQLRQEQKYEGHSGQLNEAQCLFVPPAHKVLGLRSRRLSEQHRTIAMRRVATRDSAHLGQLLVGLRPCHSFRGSTCRHIDLGPSCEITVAPGLVHWQVRRMHPLLRGSVRAGGHGHTRLCKWLPLRYTVLQKAAHRVQAHHTIGCLPGRCNPAIAALFG